ncbi:uncharacterized protein [Rutidosis leptorrhynchoides]|uniref:uncharacterized protein n=1 Tax=Rutidosis leptorrhynchoides TaxID=125765 RepID=UPI003A98D823
MEQNSKVITKSIWKLVRVMFFMLKKGIIKRKLLVHLNMLMKRDKITRKASFSRPPLEEYEFSCKNTPSFTLFLFSTHKKHQRTRPTYDPPLVVDNCDEIVINSAVLKSLGMLTNGKSPLVERMSMMDSPFQVTKYGEDDIQVDDAAERFIRRFYNDRRLEN